MMCPTGCGRHIDSLKFVMCGPCWKRVPIGLQAEVYATWGARQANPRDENAVAEHEAAKDAAIRASIARRR